MIGYGSLGEALIAQGGRAEEASKAFDDALACCPAGVPPHLQRAYAHYCGAYAARCEERAAWPDWPGSLVTPTYVFGKLEGPWAGHEAGTRREL